MLGGLGICGRPFCCATFMDEFQPVSIKMAKTQNLSLNPTKISGTCGRLMCCLKYEQDAYEDLLRNSPKVESFVDTPEGRGTVVEVDLLRQRVKVRMEDSPETIGVFSNDDIAILRSGKAKKNDQPIPDDWAPISGSGKREKPQPKEENTMVLDNIKFRYSTEQIVEEPEVMEEEPVAVTAEAEADTTKHRSRRRNRKPRPQGEKAPASETAEAPKQEKAPKAEKPAEPKAEGEEQPKSNKNHRRHHNYRRHRKPHGQGNSGGSQE